ncbi:hypothetical protein BH24CHL7_BH24CHL7_12740 [soil metagenome]
MTCAALVLAAGSGTRFGGHKLLANLDGRPLLQHVLDTLAATVLAPVVVVVGDDADRLRRELSWRDERVVINPLPARGLASSVQLGMVAIAQSRPPPRRVLLLLGDQPRLSAEQIASLLTQPVDSSRPIIVPRYEDGQPGNPVLLERAGWPILASLTGDRGLSQLFAVAPQLLRYVDLPGSNPDVDTPHDLTRLTRDA